MESLLAGSIMPAQELSAGSMGIQAGTSNAENQDLKEATEMNTKTNTNSFFNKIVSGIAGLLILSPIVFLVRLAAHSWIFHLRWF